MCLWVSPVAGFLIDTTLFHSSTVCGMSVEKEERDRTRIEKGKHKKRKRGRSNIKTDSLISLPCSVPSRNLRKSMRDIELSHTAHWRDSETKQFPKSTSSTKEGKEEKKMTVLINLNEPHIINNNINTRERTAHQKQNKHAREE